MLLRTADTIVAVASAAGAALRGIVRATGPECLQSAQQWFQPHGEFAWSELRHPTAIAGAAKLGSTFELPGELLVWPGGRSYTRQPTVEFHTLGSPPLLDRLVDTICRHGARAAEPGEFTLRAFLAGRLDLTQAEAVLGVIDAGSQAELDVALRQLGGGLAQPLSHLRDELLDLLAHVEAGLDFVEEDIEFIERDRLLQQLSMARDEVATLAERMSARSAAAAQYRVVLYGRPNAGKSSLLNALARSQKAIVSPESGTTRDYVTAEIDCGPYRCLLIDTAGMESMPGVRQLEAAAQSQTRQQWHDAHLRLLCVDSTQPSHEWERAEIHRDDASRLTVLMKCDDANHDAETEDIRTSAVTGLGLEALRQAVAARLEVLAQSHGDVVAGTALRCRDSLQRAHAALQSAITAVECDAGEEFVAGDLRVALDELGRVAGAVYTDDLLDRIFSRFCIGK